jgi:4-hydroxy-tetrahydrodipicolinate reductase
MKRRWCEVSDYIKIALFGAAGKMGRELLQNAERFPGVRIAYGYDAKQIGERVEGITIVAAPSALPEDVRVVMDFSAAGAVLEHLESALSAGSAFLCGVTGLAQDVMNELRAAANEIPVLHAANFAPGMNVMFVLAQQTAQALPDYTRHIIETHHAAKKDAPSGTALRLAKAIEDVTGNETEITALRMGDVAGEHRLIFGGPGERLEIVHRADSRAVFAVGALRAAEWLAKKSPGFYGMKEVMGE